MADKKRSIEDPEIQNQVKEYAAGLLTSHTSIAQLVDVSPADGKVTIAEWLDAARKNPQVAAAVANGTLCDAKGESALLEQWAGVLKSKFPMMASAKERDEMIAAKLEDVWNNDVYAQLDKGWRQVFDEVAAGMKEAKLADLELPAQFGKAACAHLAAKR